MCSAVVDTQRIGLLHHLFLVQCNVASQQELSVDSIARLGELKGGCNSKTVALVF